MQRCKYRFGNTKIMITKRYDIRLWNGVSGKTAANVMCANFREKGFTEKLHRVPFIQANLKMWRKTSSLYSVKKRFLFKVCLWQHKTPFRSANKRSKMYRIPSYKEFQRHKHTHTVTVTCTMQTEESFSNFNWVFYVLVIATTPP